MKTDYIIYKILKGQYLWLLTFAIAVTVFVYGQVNAKHLFNEAKSETWSATSRGAGGNHHK